jgi:1,4-dihydroxy-2-naphthoyl-CoA hydrolase
MSIWGNKPNIDEINRFCQKSLVDFLSIKFEEILDDGLVASMLVTQNHLQPHGLLHGGASVVLAETIGSVGANMLIDQKKFYAVGLSITSSHVKSVRSGTVYGTAKLEHAGRSTQIWSIEVVDQQKNIINLSRLTMIIKEKE